MRKHVRIDRRFAHGGLFSLTSIELAIFIAPTPAFTLVDWIYVSQHLLILGIALTRRFPTVQDSSLRSSAAVVVSYAYPYAQVALLGWTPGSALWEAGGLVLVIMAALLSLAALLS